MDFNKYYLDQIEGTNSFSVFRGSPYQRGYGLGSAFRRFISWAIPLLKEYALPIIKNVGKDIVHNAAHVAKEAIDGRDIKESAKEKFKSSIEKLHQFGRGKKRKKKFLKLKRKLDIFDR